MRSISKFALQLSLLSFLKSSGIETMILSVRLNFVQKIIIVRAFNAESVVGMSTMDMCAGRGKPACLVTGKNQWQGLQKGEGRSQSTVTIHMQGNVMYYRFLSCAYMYAWVSTPLEMFNYFIN